MPSSIKGYRNRFQEVALVKKDETLYINLLGEFSISNDYHKFRPTGRSQQMIRMVAYIVANKDIDISKEKMIDILWPGEGLDNPGGALRNLVYRCRNELERFFPESEEKKECILYRNGNYSWNPVISCHIDAFEFEHLMSLADKESDLDAQFNYFEKAHALYKGEFLPQEAQEEWVIFRSVYYRNLYTRCVLSMCRYYQSRQDYENVINLCNRSTMVDVLDEQIHMEKIKAYLSKDSAQQALEYYYSISELFSQKYGVEMSDAMQEMYVKIEKCLSNQPLDINSLEKNLKDDNHRGTFYCNFDMFRNVYQINLRSSRRSQRMRYLILMTLEDSRHPGVSTNYLKDDMEAMHEVLGSYLRSSDVYTQSSPTQFSLILTVVNEKGKNIAIERVKKRFEEKHHHPEVKLYMEERIIH